MSLITEDGTGLVDAESYLSVAASDTYHEKMGNTAWLSLDSETKEQCLRRATRYMVQQFRGLWKGNRRLTTQSLDWPRLNVLIDDYTTVGFNVIPQEVKNACAELALRANIGELNADLSQAVRKETVGPLTVEYDTNSSRRVSYGSIVAELQPFLRNSSTGANMKLVRS